MRRALLVVVLLVAGIKGVDVLGDMTQTRADRIVPGSRSEVLLEVQGRRYKHDLDAAARHLVAACAGTTRSVVLGDPGVVEVEPGVYRFDMQPGLGTHNRRKLVGCLEDLTVDRLQGQVVAVEHIAPPGARPGHGNR